MPTDDDVIQRAERGMLTWSGSAYCRCGPCEQIRELVAALRTARAEIARLTASCAELEKDVVAVAMMDVKLVHNPSRGVIGVSKFDGNEFVILEHDGTNEAVLAAVRTARTGAQKGE